MRCCTSWLVIVAFLLFAPGCNDKPAPTPAPETEGGRAESATGAKTHEAAEPEEPEPAEQSRGGGEIRIQIPAMYGDQQGDVRELVAGKMSEYRECYDAQLARDEERGFEGRIHFRADLEEDGSLGNPRVSENGTGREELGKCIVEEMKGWSVTEDLAANHEELQLTVGFGY
jgi:hypothetical protein